jgi:hypothetical protein
LAGLHQRQSGITTGDLEGRKKKPGQYQYLKHYSHFLEVGTDLPPGNVGHAYQRFFVSFGS